MHIQIRKLMMVAAIFMALFIPPVTLMPSQAKAHCCSEYGRCVACVNAQLPVRTRSYWRSTTSIINNFVTDEFDAHRSWYVAILWEDNILPALMMMADQFSAVAMQQTMIIGTFLDAKHQMETQRILETVRAQAHKDYHPSQGMCEFGSTVKSLAASERKGELNAHVMSQRAQDRQLGNTNVAAATGPDADFKNRLEQYKIKFCDPKDNNAGLDVLCAHSGGVGATNHFRKNKDVDYARTIEYPRTLNIDFSDSTLTDEEEEVLAMASNLYGHEVFQRVRPATKFKRGAENARGTRKLYLDSRALIAKRSVAENSFNAITSMKSSGSDGSKAALLAIANELSPGGSGAQMLGIDGGTASPSYYAQMEFLTKKIYQNPDFYTNLYDKPANVERKKVAMQAIGLMQKFDLFKSYLRNEANLSVLLELALVDLQTQVENEFSSQQRSGR